MKRKLVLKSEKLRLLTASRLATILGGAQATSQIDPSAVETGCSCPNSQAAICVSGSWG